MDLNTIKRYIKMKKKEETAEVEIIFGEESIDAMSEDEREIICMHLFDEMVEFYQRNPDKYKEILKENKIHQLIAKL